MMVFYSSPIKALKNDRKASVAVTFGLLVLPIVLAVGLAVDTWRLIDARQTLQDLADNAALAGAGAYSDASQQTNAQAVATAVYNDSQLPTWVTRQSLGVTATGSTAGIDSRYPGVSDYSVTVNATGSTTLYFLPLFKMALPAGGLQINVTATALNPIVTINFVNKTGSSGADDWDRVYFYMLSRSSAGAWNYLDSFNVASSPGATTPLTTASNGSITNGNQVFDNCQPFLSVPATNTTPAYTLPTYCNKQYSDIPAPISSVTASATQKFSFALEDMTSGGEGYSSDPSQYATGWPYGYTGQYAETYHTTHDFYGSYAIASLPPDNTVDAQDLTGTPSEVTGYKTFDAQTAQQNGAHIPNTSPQYFPNQNCSLQVSLSSGSSLPSNPPSAKNCATPGVTDTAYLYGTPTCAQLHGQTLTYWWNDMGDVGGSVDDPQAYRGDDFNYTDVVYTVSCGGGPTNVYLYK